MYQIYRHSMNIDCYGHRFTEILRNLRCVPDVLVFPQTFWAATIFHFWRQVRGQGKEPKARSECHSHSSGMMWFGLGFISIFIFYNLLNLLLQHVFYVRGANCAAKWRWAPSFCACADAADLKAPASLHPCTQSLRIDRE